MAVRLATVIKAALRLMFVLYGCTIHIEIMCVYLLIGRRHRHRTLAIQNGRTNRRRRQDQVGLVTQRTLGFDQCDAFVVQLFGVDGSIEMSRWAN